MLEEIRDVTRPPGRPTTVGRRCFHRLETDCELLVPGQLSAARGCAEGDGKTAAAVPPYAFMIPYGRPERRTTCHRRAASASCRPIQSSAVCGGG